MKKLLILLLLIISTITYSNLSDTYEFILKNKNNYLEQPIQVNIITSGLPYCDGIIIYLRGNETNETIYHEMGHLVHSRSKYNCDIEEINVEKLEKMWKDTFGFSERRNESTQHLQDLISALSRGKIHTRYKHNWEKANRNNEVFANIYSIIQTGDEKQNKFLKEIIKLKEE